MKRTNRVFCGCIALASMAGCAVDVEGGGALEAETTAQEIRGGEAAPAYREGAILQKDGNPHCSGALIAPEYVLTAGHCVDGLDASEISLHFPYAGGVSRQARRLISTWAHPPQVEFVHSDTALVRLNAPVALGSHPYPILSGIAPGDYVRTFGRRRDGQDVSGQMFIGAPRLPAVHNANYYRISPALNDPGDSGGPVFLDGIVSGTQPNVIVAVNSGGNAQTDYLARTDAALDLIESHTSPPACSAYSSDEVRLQLHKIKMIRNAELGAGDLRWRLTLGARGTDWSAVHRGVTNGLTLPDRLSSPYSFLVSSLTQHGVTASLQRDTCVPARIEIQERNKNVLGQWSTSRSVSHAMTYCYDASEDQWELQDTGQPDGTRNLSDGRFELDVSWKAIRTRACSQEAPSSYRLRHVPTNQCIYPHGGNGQTANHWQCWDDPNMRFSLDPVGANRFRIRNVATNQCLYGHDQNGGTANHWQCWDDPSMVFVMDPVSDTTFRLRHERTGKCLYPSGGNGGTMNVWSCWDDPNMVFTLDAAGPNWARTAAASAQTTFSGYSVERTNDGDRSTALGGSHSWANRWGTPDLPQYVTYDFGGERTVSRVNLFTTASYALQDFDIVYRNGSSWITLRSVTGNTAARRDFVFPPVRTDAIAVVTRRGPQHQTNHVRINEIELY